MLMAAATWLGWSLNLLVLMSGVLMVFLVLLQRARGGGLAGAFGGAGGASAFGSQAGRVFRWITLTVAAIWLLAIMFSVMVMHETREETGTETVLVEP
jgi:preprotein translocase subunit SecG